MENWLAPDSTSHLPNAENVLVLAPHPDDETYGCGGVLALYRQEGINVHVHVFTDGAGYAEEELRAGLFETRKRETEAALKVLDVGEASYSIFADRSLTSNPALSRLIIDLISEHDADLVIVPSLSEIHPDHLAVGRAALAAVASISRNSIRVPSLLFYEIGSAQKLGMLVDITKVWSIKAAAMDCFISQQQQQNYSRQIEALNIYRTYTLPASVSHAEAYAVLTPQYWEGELNKLEHPADEVRTRWTETALVAATVRCEATQNSLFECQRELHRLQSALVSSDERLKMSGLALQHAKEDVEKLQRSSSWRLTAPLRFISRSLRRLF